MSDYIRITHLLDDMAIGGVTRALDIFNHDSLENTICDLQHIRPNWKVAPIINADIIITHFPPSWNKLPFLLSLKMRNSHARIIHVEHSYIGEWMDHNVKNIDRFRVLLQRAYALYDHVIFVSHAQAKWAKKFATIKPSSYSVIEPFCRMNGLDNIKLPCFSKDKPLTIGSYGRFVDNKGFQDLIDVFNALGNNGQFRLLIGGFGPTANTLIQQAKDNPYIDFYGQVSDHIDFFNRCDIFAVPSHYETYGMVATEAKIAGRPILVNPVGGLTEQVDNAGLCVDFTNIENAAKLLSNLHNMPLVSMAFSARESIVGIDHIRARKWRELIDDMMMDSCPPAMVA